MQNSAPDVAAATKVCPFCGATIVNHAQKCQACGEWLVTRYGKSWVTTMFLCAFLGGLGVHDFYNKKSGLGIAKIFTFFGFCFIWPTIDFIMILCGSYRDGDGLELDRKPTKGRAAALCALGLICCAGMHRFYTKHIGIGFLQLFTIGGFWLWTLIDLVMIIVGKFKDADGNYLK